MLVATSILPLADFARQVGGERVLVEAMVPAGASPHAYEFTPDQLRFVSRARVLVLNGAGLEHWADDLIASVSNPDLVVVRAADGLPLLRDDAAGAQPNPHVWLSPRGAMHQVEAIRDALIAADPAGAEAYRLNAERYLAELRALDGEFRARVAGFSSRKFIAFHSAWAYLAADYGLEQVAVVEPAPGQEAAAGEIAAVVQAARSSGVKAIFAEQQLPEREAEVIAEECGAQVLVLDPLGSPPDYLYVDMMRHNLDQLSKALQ